MLRVNLIHMPAQGKRSKVAKIKTNAEKRITSNQKIIKEMDLQNLKSIPKGRTIEDS